MAKRKPFLLRVDPEVLDQLQRWADDDFRSLNGQIEFVLRRALAERGRARVEAARPGRAAPESEPASREPGASERGASAMGEQSGV